MDSHPNNITNDETVLLLFRFRRVNNVLWQLQTRSPLLLRAHRSLSRLSRCLLAFCLLFFRKERKSTCAALHNYNDRALANKPVGGTWKMKQLLESARDVSVECRALRGEHASSCVLHYSPLWSSAKANFLT